MKHATVTVGIPAYNEAENIGALLRDLLRQSAEEFSLEKILVYSDGSTDRTNEIVRSLRDARVELIEGPGRQGLACGQNVILERTKSDVLVLVNADMRIDDDRFLEKLTRPIREGKAELTSSDLRPMSARGRFERILETGFLLKNTLFESIRGGKTLYTCHGACRAFSRRFFAQFRFTQSVGEDAYSYLSCIARNFRYAYVKDAVLFLRVPATSADNDKQSFRFSRGKETLMKEFPKELVEQEMYIPVSAFFRGALSASPLLFRHPIRSISYMIVVVTTRIRSFFAPAPEELWDVSTTSKRLR